jgi:hypothetical protein
MSHHGTGNSTEQQSPEECTVKEPILDHPAQFDFRRGWLTVPGAVATVDRPKARSSKHSSSESIKSVCESAQDSEDENSTKQPPRTGRPTAEEQTTHFDFSPYWEKEAEFVTDLFNTKKISAEEPSPEDECLSKKTPAQTTTPSKGQHNKGQSATSGKGTRKQKNRNNRKANK